MIATDLKDFLRNPAAPESRNDPKPELCARASHVSSQDGRGSLAHPAPSKGTAMPCPVPALLPPWAVAQELLIWEGARRSQIPAWLREAIQLADGSWSRGHGGGIASRWAQSLGFPASLGIWGFNGCSSCAGTEARRALPRRHSQTSATLTLPRAPHTVPGGAVVSAGMLCVQGCSACRDEASLRRWIPPLSPLSTARTQHQLQTL